LFHSCYHSLFYLYFAWWWCSGFYLFYWICSRWGQWLLSVSILSMKPYLFSLRQYSSIETPCVSSLIRSASWVFTRSSYIFRVVFLMFTSHRIAIAGLYSRVVSLRPTIFSYMTNLVAIIAVLVHWLVACYIPNRNKFIRLLTVLYQIKLYPYL
jgi:hypothetical protein